MRALRACRLICARDAVLLDPVLACLQLRVLRGMQYYSRHHLATHLQSSGRRPLVPAHQDRGRRPGPHLQAAACPVPVKPGAELGQGAHHMHSVFCSVQVQCPWRPMHARSKRAALAGNHTSCTHDALRTRCAPRCPPARVSHPQEFARWLGDRVEPIVVDDTCASAVKNALQVRNGSKRGHKPCALPCQFGRRCNWRVAAELICNSFPLGCLPRSSGPFCAPAASHGSWSCHTLPSGRVGAHVAGRSPA